jgi:hypothetical protein
MHAHTAWVIFAAAMLHGALRSGWLAYKKRKMCEPTPMKLKNGVYVPWGIEERSHWWKMRVGEVGFVWFGLIGVGLLSKWAGWWPGF